MTCNENSIEMKKILKVPKWFGPTILGLISVKINLGIAGISKPFKITTQNVSRFPLS